MVGVVAVSLLGSGPARAQADASGTLTVQLGPGEGLRDLAERYLQDPDLWPAILRLNGLASITDVRPGMTLQIPVSQVTRANQAIEAALAAIQAATQAGARLFAAEQIGEAIHLHGQAVAARLVAAWDQAAELAGKAEVQAAQALEAAVARRDVPAEALLSDRQGWVEGQRPQELVWSERGLNAILIEEEKVRTLSRSTAQITFRDDSRLRLNANSHALVQRMRVDPLTRREEAKVSLIEGDFYALLGGQSARKRFEVEIPDVEADIQSNDFWVSHDRRGAKFTNYDTGVMTIAAQGESVTLGRNEGAVVRPGQAPAGKVEVLPSPALLGPDDDALVVTATVELRWAPVADAAGYWLEIALDPDFRRMTDSRWGLGQTAYASTSLAPGAYYWRAAALDRFGLPGERSPVRRIRIQADTTPPFLTIEQPEQDAILRRAPVTIGGATEPGVSLRHDGAPVTLAADGRFELALEPAAGLTTVRLEARDAAGNVTTRERTFRFMPDRQAEIAFDPAIPRWGPRHFLTSSDELTLAGTTTAGAGLAVRSATETVAAARTGSDGSFRVNLPLVEATQSFTLEVVAPSGFATTDELTVTVDRTPPAIALDQPPPSLTAVEWLVLAGRLDEAASLTLNGAPVALAEDGGFEQIVPLIAGRNGIELAATDLVGNLRVASWAVALDQEAPALLGQEVRAEGERALRIEVAAADPSGLRQAAPFTLQIGGRTERGVLELDQASGRYGATIALAPPAAGAARLTGVELEDYAGNRRQYRFD
jgi:hypothetical protein